MLLSRTPIALVSRSSSIETAEWGCEYSMKWQKTFAILEVLVLSGALVPFPFALRFAKHVIASRPEAQATDAPKSRPCLTTLCL
jgi:hypothetical protein